MGKSIHDRIIVLSERSDAAKRQELRAIRNIKILENKLMLLEKERASLLVFSEELLQTFKEEVEKLLTAAIRSVFDDRKYEFKINFKRRVDRIDTETFIQDGSLDLIPKEDMGGGIKPIIGFPMRLIMLGDHRKLIWLDEPMKGALGREDELLPRAIRMFKEVSEKLKVQIIINTHEIDFVDIADKAYRFIHTGRRTKTERI